MERPENCIKCKLWETSCTGTFSASCVMGVGPKNAKIMLVGESLGQQEVIERCPFVGSAGKLLNEVLEKAELKREEIYISNVCKCRPPENRTPKSTEVKFCLPFLLEEIKEVKPKVICVLGSIALDAILKRKGITRIRGNIFEIEIEGIKVKVIPTYHPAYVLRFPEHPNYKEELLKDIKLVKKVSITDDYKPEKLAAVYKCVTEEDEIPAILNYINWIKEVKYFSYDIETTGFNFLKDKILCMSLSCKMQTAISFTEKLMMNPIIYKELKEILESKEILKMGHNFKFDNKFLKTYGIEVKLPLFDTMLAHYLIDENNPHGLKDLAYRYTDMGGYDEGIDYKDFIETFKNNPIKIMEYNCADVDCTIRLYRIFKEEMNKEKVSQIHDYILIPLSIVLAETEYNGVVIDLQYMKNLDEELTNKISDIEFRLLNSRDVIEAEKLTNNSISIDDKKYKKFNLKSTKDLQTLFFKVLKLIPLEKTKTGYSTDANTLEYLSKNCEIAKLILDYRKVSHDKNTYIEQMKNNLDDKGRVHTDYMLHGAVSGRIISHEPNLQNIPRDSSIKKLFISEPNCLLVSADYKQVDYRVWMHYANDEKALEDIKNGLDIHSEVACYIWPHLYKPGTIVKGEHRVAAKTVVFGLIFGRGIKSLTTDPAFRLTESEALRIIKWFFNKYPKANEWIENQKKLVKRDKQVRNFFGRVRRLPEIDSKEEQVRSEILRQCINVPIQSMASDITSIATIRVYNLLKNNNMKTKLFFTIHDSVKYNVPIEELDKAIELINIGLGTPIKGVNFPLVTEFEIGRNWGEMIELEDFNKDRNKYLREWKLK